MQSLARAAILFDRPGGGGSYVGPVANNTIMPTALTTTGQAEQSTIHTVRAPGGITNIQIVFPGYIVSGGYLAVTPLATDYVITACAVEYPVGSSTWYNVTKGGSTTWTVTAAAGNNYSDLTALGITIPDGADFRLYYRMTGANLPTFTTPNAGALFTDEGLNTGASSTNVPKAVTSSDGTLRRFRICPVAILGTRTGDSVAILGDSQQAFSSASYIAANQAPANHNRGDIAATIGGGYAYVNLSVGGDQYSTWLFSGYGPIAELANTASIIITQKGINEFNNKAAPTAAVALGWPARILPLFKGKKIIAATVTPRTTSTGNTTAVVTASASAGIVTVTAVTSGTILPGMAPSAAGPNRVAPYGTSGTTGTGGTGTYALINAAGAAGASWGSVSVTFTGAFIAANGSDQALASYSAALPTYNAGLTFSGLLPAPLDRYTPVNNGTVPNKWTANGNAYGSTVDGLHLSTGAAYTTMPAQSATWAAQLAALAPVNPTAPPVTLALTGASFASGRLNNGTVTRNDVFPGNGRFGLIMRVVVPVTHNTAFQIMPNLTNLFVKTLTINATGQVVAVNAISATYATSAAINDGLEHEIGIFDDGAAQALYVDGVLVASAAYAHPTNGSPLLSFIASSVAATAVSIRQVSLWNFPTYTAGYTPVLYSGIESGLIALWPLATDGSGTLGPVLPQ